MKTKTKTEVGKKMIAVMRIRNTSKANPHIRDALNTLRLRKKHTCVVIPNTESAAGMIKKVKDYTTFGEIDTDTFAELLKKRGKLAGNKPLTDDYLKQKVKMDIEGFAKAVMDFKAELKDIPGVKLWFKLPPPQGGFERIGIKKPFSIGGALGYRGENINKLLRRMI